MKYSSLHPERNLDSLTVLTGLKHSMNVLLREGGKWKESRGIWDPVISYLYQSHAIIAAPFLCQMSFKEMICYRFLKDTLLYL